MRPVRVRRACYDLGYSVLALLVVAAVSAVIASPHPKAVMDLSAYGSDDYSIPYTLADVDNTGSGSSGQEENSGSMCTLDGQYSAAKMRRQIPCNTYQTPVENDSTSGKKPDRTNPTAQDEDVPKPGTSPDKNRPAVKPSPPGEGKGDNPDPGATPDLGPLGPLYVPINGHEIRGPCKWPLRFVCCTEQLTMVLGNIGGCWLCTRFSVLFHPFKSPIAKNATYRMPSNLNVSLRSQCVYTNLLGCRPGFVVLLFIF